MDLLVSGASIATNHKKYKGVLDYSRDTLFSSSEVD
jgi:hypothetical protein